MGEEASVLYFEMNLVIKKGTNERRHVIIRNALAETELGEIRMVKALLLVLDQFPKLSHLDFLPEVFSEILCLPQAAKKLFASGKMTGGTRYEGRPFGGKVHLWA